MSLHPVDGKVLDSEFSDVVPPPVAKKQNVSIQLSTGVTRELEGVSISVVRENNFILAIDAKGVKHFFNPKYIICMESREE